MMMKKLKYFLVYVSLVPEYIPGTTKSIQNGTISVLNPAEMNYD